jgi:hypothetical protein
MLDSSISSLKSVLMFSFRFIESTIIVLVMKQARQINIRILASISRLKNNVTWNTMPRTPHGNRRQRCVAQVLRLLRCVAQSDLGHD